MNKQRGFTVVEGLLIVLIISVVGFVGYTVWNNQQDEETKIGNYQQCVDAGNPSTRSYPGMCSADGQTFTQTLPPDLDAEEAEAISDEEAKNEEPTVEASEQPNSSTASTPEASPPQPPDITPFTAANCVGDGTVYVSNPNGTQGSYKYPDNWEPVTSYSYGQAINIYCLVGDSAFAPDYVLGNDDFIKASDLSTTKP